MNNEIVFDIFNSQNDAFNLYVIKLSPYTMQGDRQTTVIRLSSGMWNGQWLKSSNFQKIDLMFDTLVPDIINKIVKIIQIY